MVTNRTAEAETWYEVAVKEDRRRSGRPSSGQSVQGVSAGRRRGPGLLLQRAEPGLVRCRLRGR